MEELVRKYALQNAVIHGGTAESKAVLGKVLAENPDLRKDAGKIRKEVEKVVGEVNSLSREKQEERLKGYDFNAPEKKGREGLPPLPGAATGKVVTRFAPAPTGPLNLLQALRALLISHAYAKEYRGKFILRFEDTDPKSISKDYIDMIREDVRSLGVEPDKEFVQSDYMQLYYKKAELLLEKGKAYVCTCPAVDFQELKKGGKECPCRWASDKSVLRWRGMLEGKYSEGQAVVRLMTSMQDPNPAMRDPPLLRVVDSPHPLRKEKVWPLYNFANVVMDNFCGVTHAFRGKEHEHNTAIQEKLYKELGAEPPITVNFGMLYLPGEKLHTRDIKKAIAEGRYSGWDDLRLHTIRAFLRRGFLPEAIKQFSLACGLSKTDIRVDLRNLETLNRQLLDPETSRYFAVVDPVELDISRILEHTGLHGTVKVRNHPEKPDNREMAVTGKVFVSRQDMERFKGKRVRLMDLFNVQLEERPELEKEQGFDMKTPKIQWVSSKGVELKILYPDRVEGGFGEQALGSVKSGKVVQLVRIGFCKVESRGKLVYAHK